MPDIKYITTLTLPQTFLILDYEEPSVSKLLYYTLLDLLAKKVLLFREVTHHPGGKGPEVINYYVEAGECYQAYKPYQYEKIILSLFSKNLKTSFQILQLIALLYQSIESLELFTRTIVDNKNVKHYFTKSLIQNFTSGYSLTDKGFEVKLAIEDEIMFIKKQLLELETTNPKQAELILASIGANRILVTEAYQYRFKIIEDFIVRNEYQYQLPSQTTFPNIWPTLLELTNMLTQIH